MKKLWVSGLFTLMLIGVLSGCGKKGDPIPPDRYSGGGKAKSGKG